MVVTVRCGHCTSLLSVNLMKASFIPLHLLTSLSHMDEVPITYLLFMHRPGSLLHLYIHRSLLLILALSLCRRGTRRLQLQQMVWKKKRGRRIRRRRTVQRLWLHLQKLKMKIEMLLVFTKLSTNVRCVYTYIYNIYIYSLILSASVHFSYNWYFWVVSSTWETTTSSFRLQLLHQVRNRSKKLCSLIYINDICMYAFSQVCKIVSFLGLNWDREEIRRLKAQNPSMAHKEAFSLAAKNVLKCLL